MDFLSHTVMCVLRFYFGFSRISSVLMPLASSFFSTALASAFLASSAALASAFAFFASRDATSFSTFFRTVSFSFRSAFKVSMLAVDGCNLSIQRRNNLLLLRNLGSVVFSDIGFGTIFATFRSEHKYIPHFYIIIGNVCSVLIINHF